MLHDLVGGNYQFLIADQAGNGICCANGTGSIRFQSGTQVLWEGDGSFTEQLVIDLEVNTNGDIAITPVGEPITQNNDGEEPEIPDETLVIEDPEYPGISSTADTFSFTMNVKFHDRPEDIHITVKQKDETYFNTGYLDLFEYRGVATDANELWYQTFDDLDAGIYYLEISNVAAQGLDPGWATVTNKTTVVWETDGTDFTDSIGVSLLVAGWHGWSGVWKRGVIDTDNMRD